MKDCIVLAGIDLVCNVFVWEKTKLWCPLYTHCVIKAQLRKVKFVERVLPSKMPSCSVNWVKSNLREDINACLHDEVWPRKCLKNLPDVEHTCETSEFSTSNVLVILYASSLYSCGLTIKSNDYCPRFLRFSKSLFLKPDHMQRLHFQFSL